MADMLELPYTSPSETSDDGPALAVLGDRLFIAWVGSGNDHLNIMPSVDRNGHVEFDSDAKVIVDTFISQELHSLGGPALTTTSDGQLLLAWTHNGGGILGPGEAQSMFGITFDQQLNRTGHVPSLEDTSDLGPALANWAAGNGANIAWTGRGNRLLNVMQRRVRDDAGTFRDVFDGDTRFTSPNETSPFRPALCVSDWPNFTIYIGWTGEGDGELNTMLCNNPNPFVGAPLPATIFDSVTKVTISNETSTSALAIEALGRGLYLCWRGTGNNQINLLGMDLGSELRNKQPPSEQTTGHHPAIRAFRGRLFVAWTGEDDHLNLAQTAPLFSPTHP